MSDSSLSPPPSQSDTGSTSDDRNIITTTVTGTSPESTLEIRIGTDFSDLFATLCDCTLYQFANITYRTLLVDDLNAADVDVYVTYGPYPCIDRQRKRRESLMLYVIDEGDQINGQTPVSDPLNGTWYIHSDRSYDAEIGLILRLELQQMIVARAFNRSIQHLPSPLRSVQVADAAIHRLSSTIKQLRAFGAFDAAFGIDPTLVRSVIQTNAEWLTTAIGDPCHPNISAHTDCLQFMDDHCPHSLVITTSEPSTPATVSVPTVDDSLHTDEWTTAFVDLFKRRWINGTVPVTTVDALVVRCITATRSVPLWMVFAVIESSYLSDTLMEGVTSEQRYWYFSSLYEHMHRLMTLVAINDPKHNALCTRLMNQAITYAAERDRQLIDLHGRGLSRNPKHRVDTHLEAAMLTCAVSVYTGTNYSAHM